MGLLVYFADREALNTDVLLTYLPPSEPMTSSSSTAGSENYFPCVSSGKAMARGTKLSRKGKKEWRRNISTEDHEQFLDQKAQEERTGGSLENVANEEIFFLDKEKGEHC